MSAPKRADKLEPGLKVAVSDTSTLTVAAVRPGEHGGVDIRWQGSSLWASVPADREFDVVEEADA